MKKLKLHIYATLIHRYITRLVNLDEILENGIRFGAPKAPPVEENRYMAEIFINTLTASFSQVQENFFTRRPKLNTIYFGELG